jgi:pyruvate dehydrogenase E1 component alpha subunit
MMKYSNTVLEHLYRTMVRIRLCEESLVEPILGGEVRCPCHLYSGQEAVAAGICASLNESDYIFGNHRSHGHFFAKGCSMPDMVGEIYGSETGCARGRGGSMHLIDPELGMMGAAPIVAGTISLTMGAALAASIRQDRRVAVSFFGDGATGEGVFYECLNFAALKKLPMIFVCENNFYPTHMPIRECRVENGIHKVGEPFGISSYEVDGNDVLQVYETGKKAIEQCRNGNAVDLRFPLPQGEGQGEGRSALAAPSPRPSPPKQGRGGPRSALSQQHCAGTVAGRYSSNT